MTLKNILKSVLIAALSTNFASAQNSWATEPNLHSEYVWIANNTKSIFTVLVESDRDAETDPLLIWTNGGPGCSSLSGFINEHGPFLIPQGKSNLTKNLYSWNKVANVLYIEQPAGVGFSVCAAPPCAHNDESVAQDNLNVVIGWLNNHPEFQNRELWLSGESYAGIYLPYLLKNIDTYNQQPDTTMKINLKGMMVGNGVTDLTVEPQASMIDFMFQRAIISDDLYNQIIQNNCNWTADYFEQSMTAECEQLGGKFSDAIQGFDPYYIYGKCWGLEGQSQSMGVHQASWLSKLKDDSIDCDWSKPMNDYFNNKNNQKDWGVYENFTGQWAECSDVNYTKTANGSFQIWNDTSLSSKYKMLKFSGDADSVVSTIGSQRWIEKLNQTPQNNWQKYSIPSSPQIAGFWQRYEHMTFATIHGAGHMVPRERPEAALYLISKFMANQDL